MYKDILIMPKKVALAELPDHTADYIICTMDELEIARQENLLSLKFIDTEVPSHPYAFTEEHADAVYCFINRSDAKDTHILSCDGGESRSPAIAVAVLN